MCQVLVMVVGVLVGSFSIMSFANMYDRLCRPKRSVGPDGDLFPSLLHVGLVDGAIHNAKHDVAVDSNTERGVLIA